jgi:calcineurin-like phosphoesterase family protein
VIEMNDIYLIGDTHFYHKNIIRYCDRPFDSVEEMNEKLIKNWNNTVGKHDIVYMMGDFALCGKDKIIEIGKRLNGKKRLILGNHDQASFKTYFEADFELVYNHPILLDQFYIVSHTPQHVFDNGLYANIFAHVHNESAYVDASARTFCASAERINYTPVSFEEAKERMRGFENG